MKGKTVITVLVAGILMLFWECSRGPSKSAQEYWNSAELLFGKGEYEQTLNEYEQLVKYYPEDTLAVKSLFAMAEIYKNNIKDFGESIEVYKKIHQTYQKSAKAPNALFMIGYIYANDLNDTTLAKSYYEKFIETYPDHILVPSAQWEIKHLGKSINDIPSLRVTSKGS